MANITENTQSPAWSDGIYQIETSDPVLGGANGIANRQAKELAARTQWLKTELAKAVSSIGTNKSSADSAIATKANNTLTLTAGNGLTGGGNLSANRTLTLGTPSSINADSTNSVTATSHTHAISKASTSQAGIVALYNALNADYTDRALTAAQGKALNDKITEATAATTALSSSTTASLATKANTSTTITAGNGLTGGGNLSANRTLALGTPSSITADSTNSVTADSHTHAISKASTSQAGIVALYNGLNADYTDRALTAAQGKALNDKFTNIPQVSGLDLDTTTQTLFFKNAKSGYPTAENGGHEVGNEHSGFIVGWNGECMQFVNGGDRLFIRGNDLDISQNAWAEWGQVLTNKIGLRKTDIAIATGTINDGETIPLPKGFTQEQCKWLVSMSDSNPSETKWDSNEVDPRMHYRLTYHADSNRVVTAKMHVFDDNGDKVKPYPATASYIIIGKK